MAEQLSVSSRYLSDLLKQETGKTAMELIHIFLIKQAKNMLIKDDLSIAEIAYELGFENLPYFSRLLKRNRLSTQTIQVQFYKLNLRSFFN